MRFVRTRKKIKTPELLDRESRITVSNRDFEDITMALNRIFAPNIALQNAISMAQKMKHD